MYLYIHLRSVVKRSQVVFLDFEEKNLTFGTKNLSYVQNNYRGNCSVSKIYSENV